MMFDKKPVGIVLHEKADRLYVICEDGSAYSAKVGQPGIVMGWHEIEPIPGTPAERQHLEELEAETAEDGKPEGEDSKNEESAG